MNCFPANSSLVPCTLLRAGAWLLGPALSCRVGLTLWSPFNLLQTWASILTLKNRCARQVAPGITCELRVSALITPLSTCPVPHTSGQQESPGFQELLKRMFSSPPMPCCWRFCQAQLFRSEQELLAFKCSYIF